MTAIKFYTKKIKKIFLVSGPLLTDGQTLPIDRSTFFLKIPKSLSKAKYIFEYTKGQILFFCIAKDELLYSPGSYKHLKLTYFGKFPKLVNLSLGYLSNQEIIK